MDDPRLASLQPLAPKGSLAGRPLQLILKDQEASVALYYAATDVADKETLFDFLARGGVVVREGQGAGLDLAADVLSESGKRAALVPIGDYQAALVHADPVLGNDVRAYHLYWSDGVHEWLVQGVVQRPEEIIDFARSIYCP